MEKFLYASMKLFHRPSPFYKVSRPISLYCFLFGLHPSHRFFRHGTCYCTVENRAIPYVRILDRFREYNFLPSLRIRCILKVWVLFTSAYRRMPSFRRNNLISQNLMYYGRKMMHMHFEQIYENYNTNK